MTLDSQHWPPLVATPTSTTPAHAAALLSSAAETDKPSEPRQKTYNIPAAAVAQQHSSSPCFNGAFADSSTDPQDPSPGLPAASNEAVPTDESAAESLPGHDPPPVENAGRGRDRLPKTSHGVVLRGIHRLRQQQQQQLAAAPGIQTVSPPELGTTGADGRAGTGREGLRHLDLSGCDAISDHGVVVSVHALP